MQFFVFIYNCVRVCVCVMRGFRFTRLGKIILKKIVRFTTRTQIYVVFGRVKVKIVRFTKRNSAIHDFWVLSSEILSLRDSWFTRRFQERNPGYN